MKVVELFCGAGGMSLGLVRAGMSIERAFDVWPDVLAVHRANVPTGLQPKNVRHISRAPNARSADMAEILAIASTLLDLKVDMICGGPPCQDFSGAGKRIEGTRADLTAGFAMTISVVRPEWFLMENVPAAWKSRAYARARQVFKRAGYGLTETVVKASDYGVPQMRKRFIVVGRLGEANGFLGDAIEAARSERETTVRDALGDDVGVHPGGEHPPETRVFFLRPYKGGQGVRSIDEPCPTLLHSARDKPSPKYQPHPNDMAPAETVRPLTFEEMSRIQGFPEGWDWSALRRQRKKGKEQAVANAVPPPLAEALGRVILARHNGEDIPRVEPCFDAWLRKEKGFSGQVLRNRKSQLNRARRLLRGRMLADIDAELAMLERAPGFETLAASVRADLRQALRLHAEWRTHSQSLAAELVVFDGIAHFYGIKGPTKARYRRKLKKLHAEGAPSPAIQIIEAHHFSEQEEMGDPFDLDDGPGLKLGRQ